MQTTQLFFQLPSTRQTAQFSRVYAVPLEIPRAVDLLETARIVEHDGVLYVAWPGQPVEKAIKVRALPLLRPRLSGMSSLVFRLTSSLKLAHQVNLLFRKIKVTCWPGPAEASA